MMHSGYAAGFFDGEGCVSFRHSLEVSITNTHLKILREFERKYGGTVSLAKAKLGDNRTAYRWRIYGTGARAFLIRMLDNGLREKAPQAWLALRLGVTPPAYRAPFLEELRNMKKVDYAHNIAS